MIRLSELGHSVDHYTSYVRVLFVTMYGPENHNSIAGSKDGYKGTDTTLLQTVAKRLRFEIRFLVPRTAFLGALNMVCHVKPYYQYF